MLTSSALGRGLVLVAVVGLGAGCSSGGGTCSVTGVAVSASPATVNTGQSSTLTATVNSSGCSGGVSWAATPAGGTLTPSGTTATFASNTTGSYTITATSTDDATKSGSATVTVGTAVACGSPNGVVVTHTSNIAASETWAGGGVTHSVPNSISINGPATVTVQPCALVALGQGASITVNAGAKLLAAGTGTNAVVYFVPADTTKPWGILRGTAATSLIELHWTLVQGGGAFGGEYHNPAIALTGPGYSSLPAPMLKVDTVLIDSPQGVGVYLDANAAFTADSQALQISNAPDFLFETTMMAVGSIPNGDYTTGNAKPAVMVDVGPNPNVFANMTIGIQLPIIVNFGGMTVAPPPATPSVPVTLTLQPGVQLYFAGTRVIFGTGNSVGTLLAQGTQAAPILFSSAQQTPAPGDWVGLWLDSAPGSQLDHVVIEYAGAASGIVSVNCRPTGTPDSAALIVGDNPGAGVASGYIPPSNLITNSTIQYSAGYGIDAIWNTSAAVNTPDLTAGNAFSSNAGCAQTYNGWVGHPCPTNGGCTAP